jgi:hypothetical protein
MLLRRSTLEGIRDGSITLAFRRWQRPTVRAGGTQLTPLGQLAIAAVDVVTLGRITEQEARRAGHPSLAALLTELRQRPSGRIYRIEFGALGADPRLALRDTLPVDDDERARLRQRLARLDARGPWTERALRLIAARPAVRAGDLCGEFGLAREDFKRNVRKLKNLGLTESLEVGYRLSPRGAELLAHWDDGARPAAPKRRQPAPGKR